MLIRNNSIMSKKGDAILTSILDIAIFGIVLMSILMMYFGPNEALASQGIALFKYYTTESNALLALIALVCFPLDLMVALGKRDHVEKEFLVLLHVGNTATTLTFLTVVAFLGPTIGYGAMYAGANLFLHLVTPLLGLCRFLFFGRSTNPMKAKESLIGISTMALYGIVYMINVFVHDGFGQVEYDWYGFGSAGPVMAVVSFFLILIGTALIAIGCHFARVGIQKSLSRRKNE